MFFNVGVWRNENDDLMPACTIKKQIQVDHLKE